MTKYICEVRKDSNDNELELVHPSHYTSASGKAGGIKFSDPKEFHAYFKKHCVSEEQLVKSAKGSVNSVFTFLFYVLLFLLIGTLIYQLCTKNGSTSSVVTGTALNQGFGKFSF